MSLKVENLTLIAWRNFKNYFLEFAPGLTILEGHNAVGKTNTIEALQYLTAAYSFRKPAPSELIYEDENNAHIKARITGDDRLLDVEMVVTEKSRKFIKNNKNVKANAISGTLFSILFNPDDLLLIKGSASKRRDELDNFGIQIHSGYRKLYTTYTHSIEQRNHLLKDNVDSLLLDAWDESVALGAATLLQQRLKLFKKLSSYIQETYREITSEELLSCIYKPSFRNEFLCNSEYISQLSRDELAHHIQDELFNTREEDYRRGITSIGPHRDDIEFNINNKSARKFASQGQQRSIVLAWKMAEVRLCDEYLDSKPLLLLDDVMSELDESRRACITNFIKNDIQTVITTTNLNYFTKEQLDGVKVVSYEG